MVRIELVRREMVRSESKRREGPMKDLVKYEHPATKLMREVDEFLASTPPKPEFVNQLHMSYRPPVLASPRVCCVVNKPAAAYYLNGMDGRYHYARSGQVTGAVRRALFSFTVVAYQLRNDEVGEETCPWCGVSGNVPIFCTNCRTFTCWGTVVENRTHFCSCGNIGQIFRSNQKHFGVVPRSFY
jgi:hypothetical protein